MNLKDSIDLLSLPELDQLMQEIAEEQLKAARSQLQSRERIQRISPEERAAICTCGHIERYHLLPAVAGSNRGMVCKFKTCQCKGFLLRKNSEIGVT
jgi:lauroyl/myristoyl acyltransferase